MSDFGKSRYDQTAIPKEWEQVVSKAIRRGLRRMP